MRSALHRLQQIECHLLGSLSPAAAAQWQVQLLTDPELAADTEAQRRLYQGLQRAGRQQLRRELDLIHTRVEGAARRRSWLQAALQGLRRGLPRPFRR